MTVTSSETRLKNTVDHWWDHSNIWLIASLFSESSEGLELASKGGSRSQVTAFK